ncbi:MAG: hypothetical protein Greene041662_334 [Candidatus Peregrinibacteria bacterium Greene0416_62]|nr:MAG: hypothetical protein Greene041662_334 [Candidatus Peregrinibacteria bacterium Greene0416_62]TSD00301.1 MAG: hypothetical protein Greene101449_235 [Candidatus Peregrinibacteria bacterium Greene1014_49]
MSHARTIAGLLCISMLLPVPAAAITVDDIVSIPPVSEHYVERVLDRANAGIIQASTMTTPGGPLYDLFKPLWIFYATSAMLSLADTKVQISGMQRDLFESTPCLHLDVIILQSKIEKVRQEMHDALENKEPFRVVLLSHIIRFLNRRIEHLLRGARDPLYGDTDWARVQLFDTVDPVWCCPQGIPGNTCREFSHAECTGTGGLSFITPHGCQEWGCLLPEPDDPSDAIDPLEGKICPFDSDYLPPSATGFGCDNDALPSAASIHPPTLAEISALGDLISKREDIAGEMSAFITLVQAIDAMAGVKSNYDDFNTGSRNHLHVFGCMNQIQKEQRIGTGTALTDNFGTGTFLKDIGSGSLLQSILTGTYETRGPFSIPKNEPWLAVRFSQLLQQWGVRRPQAKDLRYPSEFPPGSERNIAQERELKKNPLLRANDWFMRRFFGSWNVYHGKKDAIPVAKSQDAQLQISEALGGAQTSINRLGGLISGHSSGLRFFTKSFSYYLRRSCIYRSCNMRLEQILRIVFQGACFPYFSGAYFGNLTAHERCKTAAEVDVSP